MDDQMDDMLEPPLPTGERALRQITIDNPVIQAKQKRLATLTIVVPALGTLAAIAMLFVTPLTWVDVWLFLAMYVATTIGVTVGFHRHFAHRSFKAAPWMRVFLGIAGSMAAQGTLVYWVATHRRHHQFSEHDGDPHSPYLFEGEKLGKLRGLWHSHLGWMMDSQMTNTTKFAKDLMRDPAIARVNDLYFTWVALGLVIPAVLGGLITMTWMGALTGLLWGGFVRMFLAHHAMWTSGSTAHIFGTRPFKTRDKSTNNGLLALPNLGEAWHNNHHAFPSSAIFGLHWWQVDPGGWFIRAAERAGIVSDVRKPTRQMIEDKKAKGEHVGGIEAW